MDDHRIPIRLPRQEWLAFGKTLKGAFTPALQGDATLVFNQGVLSVNTAWGGTTMSYEDGYDGILTIKASDFRRLVTAHTRQKSELPWIRGAIDPVLGEFSLAFAGVKARFLR